MQDGSPISWLIVILLLLLAMFFAIAETSFASVSKARLHVASENGDPRAEEALFITAHFDRAITTILICTNIVHLAAASIVTLTVTKHWGVSAVTISTVITTLVVFFFGEMLPKSIARKYSERLSLFCAKPLYFLMIVLKPAATLLTMIGNGAASLTKGEPEAAVTENDLYDIIEDMTEEGTLDEEQGDLISSALQFGDRTVESILTSRVDVAAINVEMSQEEILSFIKEQNHSLLPVYEGSVDNIIGILQIRRYIKHYIRRGQDVRIRQLIDEPFFVHQSAKIDDLLTVMSRRKLNMAVVTDNYGGTLGIVTTEDILEELVGEIWDEDDKVVRNIVPLSDGCYSVSAEEHVLDVLDELDISVSEKEEKRLHGKLMSELAYENFTGIPKEGDSFRYRNLLITVSSMNHNRIMRLRLRVTDQAGARTDKEKGGNA